MNANVPTSINKASAEELATLHGVGATLARRIVDYRLKEGPFRGPYDLSKVQGISISLAMALSPFIDWTFESDPDVSWKPVIDSKPAWDLALFAIAGVALLLWAETSHGFRGLLDALSSYERGLWPGTINTSRAILSLLRGTVMIIGSLLFAFMAITRGATRFRLALRTFVGIAWLILFTYIGTLCVYIVHVAVYLAGAEVRFDPAAILVEFSNTLLLTLMLGSFLFAGMLHIQQLTHIRKVRYIYVISFFGILILFPVRVWLLGFKSVGEMGMVAALGVVLVYFAISALRRDASSIDSTLRVVDAILGTSNVAKNVDWATWVNIRVPDPGDQKQLLKVLQEMHPALRRDTIINVFVIGVGGWLALTAIGAVVEYLVQNWLDIFLR
jgi:competence ComEA-like helix-hairpin-helix protein